MGGPSSLNWQLYRQQKRGKAQHKRVVYGVVQRAFLAAAPSFQWAVTCSAPACPCPPAASGRQSRASPSQWSGPVDVRKSISNAVLTAAAAPTAVAGSFLYKPSQPSQLPVAHTCVSDLVLEGSSLPGLKAKRLAPGAQQLPAPNLRCGCGLWIWHGLGVMALHYCM